MTKLANAVNKAKEFLDKPLVKTFVVLVLTLSLIVFWGTVALIYNDILDLNEPVNWKDFVVYGLLANAVRDFWWNPVDKLRADIVKAGTIIHSALKGAQGPAGKDGRDAKG